MRSYSESSMKNLFRRPLVMGVSFTGLLALSFSVLVLMIGLGNSKLANSITACFAISGYVGLRICTKFMMEGWEDELFYPVEKCLLKKGDLSATIREVDSELEVLPPDTLEKLDLIFEKEKLEHRLSQLKGKEELVLSITGTNRGVTCKEIKIEGALAKGSTLDSIFPVSRDYPFIYGLKAVPVTTNPLFMFEIIQRLSGSFRILIRVTGLDFIEAKRRVEASRRRNAKDSGTLQNIDSEVTFEESSKVLEAMSRGEETIAEVSMAILASEKCNLDSSLFNIEKNRELSVFSILGFRKKHFRSHILRLKTIADLIPNFADPKDGDGAVLSTVRGKPLYFSPQDPRLESLHWLVVGATGTGKSFFAGVVLKRLVDQGTPMSVLFVDHNRSFKRLVKSASANYLEPQDLNDLKSGFNHITKKLNEVGSIAVVELSDLHYDEKKSAAQFVLSHIEEFLRNRETIHPVYVVLDECWNFLRDEPVLVQRAFREFRKLNGAVVAITQSLSDFMSDASGRSIVQNAPIRILLRQGEDPNLYKGVLGLNEVEVQKLRLLKQRKGEFSECLIKTSFLSRLARLYPSEKEYSLLRTDNLREEFIQEMKAMREVSYA